MSRFLHLSLGFVIGTVISHYMGIVSADSASRGCIAMILGAATALWSARKELRHD